MSQARLLVDVGNSRVKFGVFTDAKHSDGLPKCWHSTTMNVQAACPWSQIRGWISPDDRPSVAGHIAGSNPPEITRVKQSWPKDWPAPVTMGFAEELFPLKVEPYHPVPRSAHPMLVEIHCLGDSEWPRYFLTDQSPQGVRYWSGSDWAGDFCEARLYAFLPEVCREFERLLLEEEREKFVQEFEATVTVKLHSNQPMTERELARYLDRFADLFLPTNGPTDDSLIQAEIHWNKLRKRPGQTALDSSGE